MMRWLFVPLLLSTLSALGCSSDSGGGGDAGSSGLPGGCEPRKTIFCRCATGTGEGGWKTCKADGSAYEECLPCDGSNLEETTGPGGSSSPTPSEGECGNGKTEDSEECDDGNFDDSDACLSDCRAATCGDGVVRSKTEECDDGNSDDDDACSNDCKAKDAAYERCPGLGLEVTADPAGVTVKGDFAALASNHEGTCGGADGPDAVYSFVAPSTGQVTATIAPPTGGQLDVVLYARGGDCDAGVDQELTPTGCSNEGGPGKNELIKFDVVKGNTYYVVADSASGTTAGTFELRVRLRPDEACEGVGGPCIAPGEGACREGTLVCASQQAGLTCQPGTPAAVDTCGDGIDNNCDGQIDENCGCSHPICAAGDALNADCGDPCVAQICAKDSFCCDTQWDDQCIGQVASVCGTVQCLQGTCAHSLCSEGAALSSGCDGTLKCVEKICKTDSICCGQGWDDVCVGKVADICSFKCQ